MFRRLDSARIAATARSLWNRISERFPQSGLKQVAAEVHAVAEEAAALSSWLTRPIWAIRVMVGLATLILLAVAVSAWLTLDRSVAPFTSVSDFLQGLDAAVNEIILIGLAIFFLLKWELRQKRHRALKAIHVLRSLAHVIDMHQLTKDPERILYPGRDTPSSPRHSLTPFLLTRYLDYCSELLSLVSKLAALYIQDFEDPVTLTAVDEVQDLCNGLSAKIWQKIMILLPE